MKKLFLAATTVAFASVYGLATVMAADVPPPWAYGFTAPPPPNTPQAGPNPAQRQDNVVKHTLPGSDFSFTRAQIANRFGPADWFPGDHAWMPEIVAKGREAANIYAWSLCHYPNGMGPVPPLAGRSPSYIARQLYDMQKGNRNGAWTAMMAPVVSAMSAEDILTASAYAASLTP